MLNMKCVYCGEEKENSIHGEYVCLSCLNKLYVPCENCGVWVHNDDICTVRRNREGDEVYVCKQCCDNSYTFCMECETYVRNEDGMDSTHDGQKRLFQK